jgi:hypothetical protein
MEYTKKFVLVPAEAGSIMGAVQSPHSIHATALSENLGQIANVKSVKSVEQQNREYNQELNSLLFQKKVLNQPLKFAITGEDEQESKPQSVLQASVNFFQTNRNLNQSADNLARFFNTVEALDWNRRGEIIVNGNVIPKSNLTTLMNDILSSRYSLNPIGSDELAPLLISAGLPNQFIGERSGKYSKIRPPARKYFKKSLLPVIREDLGEGTSKSIRRSLRNQPSLFANESSNNPDRGLSSANEEENKQIRGSGFKWARY